MTYIYLFEAPDYVYCGQHRCADNKDPMMDGYKGSGVDWKNYLKENDYWLINNFRKNVKKTILEIVMDDENRTCIGNVEKFWIDWTRETYGDKCINVSKGSKPPTQYETFEEAEEARKQYYKDRDKTPERIAWKKTYRETHREEKRASDKLYRERHLEEVRERDRKRNKTPERIERDRKRSKDPVRMRKSKVRKWANKNNYPNPSTADFPPLWTEEDKQEYIRRYNNH